jgi:prepilin-type processing-associated H-X9-DG protein
MKILPLNRSAELLFGRCLWPWRSPSLRFCRREALANDHVPIRRSAFRSAAGGNSRTRLCALRSRALTLVEVLAIVATLTLLAALSLSALAQRRARARRVMCVSNLKQVGLAFRVWSPSSTDWFPMHTATNFGGTRELVETGPASIHFLVMSNELASPVLLVCPADPDRRVATNFLSGFSNSNLSYFVGLDAVSDHPTRFLTGDRHLEADGVGLRTGVASFRTSSALRWTPALHNRKGNIALADGSVQAFDVPRLQEAACVTGLATNRLAMP